MLISILRPLSSLHLFFSAVLGLICSCACVELYDRHSTYNGTASNLLAQSADASLVCSVEHSSLIWYALQGLLNSLLCCMQMPWNLPTGLSMAEVISASIIATMSKAHLGAHEVVKHTHVPDYDTNIAAKQHEVVHAALSAFSYIQTHPDAATMPLDCHNRRTRVFACSQKWACLTCSAFQHTRKPATHPKLPLAFVMHTRHPFHVLKGRVFAAASMTKLVSLHMLIHLCGLCFADCNPLKGQ